MGEDPTFWSLLSLYISGLSWNLLIIIASLGVPEAAYHLAKLLKKRIPKVATQIIKFLKPRKLLLTFWLFVITCFYASFYTWSEEYLAKLELQKQIKNPQTNLAVIDNLQKQLDEANLKLQELSQKPEARKVSDTSWVKRSDGTYTALTDIEIKSAWPLTPLVIKASAPSLYGLRIQGNGVSMIFLSHNEQENSYTAKLNIPKGIVTVLADMKKQEQIILEYEFP